MTKISWSEWFDFRNGYYAGSMSQRLGQAFCNRYNITDPTLFYQTDMERAEEHIMDEYVDHGDDRG